MTSITLKTIKYCAVSSVLVLVGVLFVVSTYSVADVIARQSNELTSMQRELKIQQSNVRSYEQAISMLPWALGSQVQQEPVVLSLGMVKDDQDLFATVLGEMYQPAGIFVLNEFGLDVDVAEDGKSETLELFMNGTKTLVVAKP